MKKNNKHESWYYKEGANFQIAELQQVLSDYLTVAESEHVSHSDINRTINLVNWTTRTILENRAHIEEIISLKDKKEKVSSE
jgi:hypothetical protein